jgi:hypothetical protein
MPEGSGTIARPRELLLVGVAGLALALLMTWPLATDLLHLGRTLPTDADGQFSIWNIAWVARSIVADPLGLFDANIFAPHKLTLAYSEANLLPGAIGAPVYWLSRNPWLTLNVVLLFAFASAYAGAYLLIRHLTGHRPAAAAAAILYAFCPYVFSHLSHIQLLMTGGIPLSMLMLHRLADAASAEPPRATARPGVALGVAIAAQALACAYYGIFAALMVGYAAIVLAATRRLWRVRGYWFGLGAGAAASLAMALPVLAAFLVVRDESGFTRTLADTAAYAAKPHDYLVSSALAHRWLLAAIRPLGRWNEVLFPGMLAVVLGAAGAVIALRRRAGRDRETVLLYGTLAVLAFWASLGPAFGLYRVLYQLPTFSFLRAPSRLGLVVVFVLAIFAAFALRAAIDAVARQRRAAVIAVTALAIAAAVADLIVLPLQWYRAVPPPPGYAALAARPRATLAEFPFYGERIAFPLHAQYMLFSTAHWFPLLNGYSDVIPRDFREAAPVLATFPSDDAFIMLARRRVRYIAVHWDMMAGRQDDVRQRLVKYLPNLTVLSEDARMSLYEVVRYP